MPEALSLPYLRLLLLYGALPLVSMVTTLSTRYLGKSLEHGRTRGGYAVKRVVRLTPPFDVERDITFSTIEDLVEYLEIGSL